MKASRELIKALIPVAPGTEEADRLIVENFGFKTIPEKVAFLLGMYDASVFARDPNFHMPFESSEGTQDVRTKAEQEMDYYAMLSTIMNS